MTRPSDAKNGDNITWPRPAIAKGVEGGEASARALERLASARVSFGTLLLLTKTIKSRYAFADVKKVVESTFNHCP